MWYIDTNLKKETDKIVAMFAAETKKLGVSLHCTLGDSIAAIPWIKVDPVRLGQCVGM